MTTNGGGIKTYICTGCGIGDSIDIDKLRKISVDENSYPEGTVHSSFCGIEGLELIKKDLAEGANKVVIAACSRRVFPERFNFGSSVLVERVNLREGVAWVSEQKNEDTQMLAEDYLKMGLVKAEKTALPEPYIETLDKKILVIGGGIAGITSALEAVDAGKSVVLVEKEKELGGFLAKIRKRFPRTGSLEELEDTGIQEKIENVEKQKNINVFLSTEVESISGQPGLFDVILKSDGKKEEVRVGAIVLATGSTPYNPEKLSHLGYGINNVVSNFEFEEMAAKGMVTRPSDGKDIKSVAFIQCAGSRDENHLPYCSSFCCMATLKHAAYLREQNEEVKVFIFYKDMRTPGKYEFFYKKIQDDDGVFLTKGEVVGVEAGGNDSVIVSVKETLLGEDIKVKVDLLVLAAGTESANQNGSALGLAYRQGPELPELESGFPDSHFICFPYETRRTGVYAAGTVRQPMDSAQAEMDASGAVLKAIQCIELSSQGKSVHPRSGDTAYPEIAFDRCTQCKRCTEECPYGMYDEDEKFNPMPNPLRCRRCGTCLGACPQRCISFKDFHIDMISSQIKASSMPDEEEEKPRVLVLACENDAIPVFDQVGLSRGKLNPFIRVIGLRCLGSLNLVCLSDALSKGYDGIMLMGCKVGDDYQCHNIEGSELAEERLSKLEETLEKMAIEPERVQFIQCAINDYQKLPGIINEFMEMIEEVGPNPFKEFGDS